jgi:predicted acetyltransferase
VAGIFVLGPTTPVSKRHDHRQSPLHEGRERLNSEESRSTKAGHLLSPNGLGLRYYWVSLEMALRLVSPTDDLREPFLDMAREYVSTKDEIDFTDALVNFSTYLERTALEQRGLRAGRMPCSHFWLLDGPTVLGTSRVRHRLTPELQREIGHIGYDIRPSQRGRGHAPTLLRLTLDRARDLKLSGVWIICDTDNIPSVATAERCGASFHDELISERTGLPIRRYWTAL